MFRIVLIISFFFFSQNNLYSQCIDSTLINPNCPCILIFQPVCGCDGVVYSNDCYAQCNGVTSWTGPPVWQQGMPCQGPSCAADFSSMQDSLDPFLIYFTDLSTSTDTIMSWVWDFGDGSSPVTGQNVSHTFPTYGFYQICLTITDNAGCSNTVCLPVTINSNTCQADFSYYLDTTGLCLNPTTSPCYFFQDQSTQVMFPVTYLWDFGDGTTSSYPNPIAILDTLQQASFLVCLTITDAAGCTTTTCDSLFFNTVLGCTDSAAVNYDPVANVDNGSCVFCNLTISEIILPETSIGASDGSIDITVNGSSCYSGSPILITEYDPGSPDLVEIQNVSSSPVDVTGWRVVVSNSYTDINNSNIIEQVLSGAMSSGQIQYWTDGTTNNYWGNNLFWNPGAYPSFTGWIMILDDNDNVMDVFVANWPASFITSSAITISTGSVVSLDGHWTGDGFDQNGMMTSSSASRIGGIDNNDATDFVVLPTSGAVTNNGLMLPFVSGSSNTSYDWNNGDTTANISGLSVGTYDLSVVDCFGCTAMGSFTVPLNTPGICVDTSIIDLTLVCPMVIDPVCGCDSVTYVNSCEAYYYYGVTSWTSGACPLICDVDFSYGINGNAVNFLANAQNLSPGATVTTYIWDYGDGSMPVMSVSPSSFYTYNLSGTYIVSLSIVTSDGCLATYFDTIFIAPPPITCDVDFSYITSGNDVDFTSNIIQISSGASVNYYIWNFGDGSMPNVSPTTQVSHTYNLPGIYTVLLTMYTSDSCTATYSDVITILPASNDCVADFSFYEDTLNNCFPCYQFNDQSYSATPGVSITNWSWSFGDGNVSNAQNPLHTFTPSVFNDSVFVICLTISAEFNNIPFCTDVFCDTIILDLSPSNIQNINSNINIYPNPSNNKINVEVNIEGNFDLVITDLYGREIKVLEENSAKVIFSRENLESGFYFFSILINGINVHREKVVLLK